MVRRRWRACGWGLLACLACRAAPGERLKDERLALAPPAGSADGLAAEAAQPAVRSKEQNRVAIVLDIDETLSVTDYYRLAFRIGARDDSYLHRGSKEVLRELARDFDLIYLTARPQWLFHETRQWLRRQELPPGLVLTTARFQDVIWPGPFKARAIATLRATMPLMLIGIGDRSTDATAYAVNGMLVLIVNAGPFERFEPQTQVFESWTQVGQFVREHRDVLRNPQRLREVYGVTGGSPHPQSIHGHPPMSILLPLQLVLAGPGLLIEPLVKLELGVKQAQALRAIASSRIPFGEAIERIERAYPRRTLLRIELLIRADRATYVAHLIEGSRVREIWLDASSGEVRREAPEGALRSWRAERTAREQARLDFHQAMRRATAELQGAYWEAEVEFDDRRPTYEFAVQSLGRFMEIELDAVTGEVIDVEDETVGVGAPEIDSLGSVGGSTSRVNR
jgi:uncharacterized membrane protein YkoI